MQFNSTGWLYRYDAYIVLVGCVILVDTLTTILSSQYGKSADKMILSNDIELKGVVILMALLLNTPLAARAAHAIQDYPLAVMNIYEQPYQMGTFIKKFYDGRAVAANDIGAINYLANIKTLDLFGLGSIEVAQSKRMGRYDRFIINELTSQYGVEMIMIYKVWFPRQIPENWVEIGEWQITNNVACGYDRVAFYVPNGSLQEGAIANLREFSDLLPTTVIQSGLYTER